MSDSAKGQLDVAVPEMPIAGRQLPRAPVLHPAHPAAGPRSNRARRPTSSPAWPSPSDSSSPRSTAASRAHADADAVVAVGHVHGLGCRPRRRGRARRCRPRQRRGQRTTMAGIASSRNEQEVVVPVSRGFTEDERAWLASQRLGRLATVSPDGVVGNAPVTFFVRADDTIDIGGMRMGATKKFRNVQAGSRAGLRGRRRRHVGRLATHLSRDPWHRRGDHRHRPTGRRVLPSDHPHPPRMGPVLRPAARRRLTPPRAAHLDGTRPARLPRIR